MGFHAPGAAPELFGAAALTLGWALIADAPLGIVHLIAPRLHRTGLIALAVALAAIPLATGKLTNLAVLLPCLIAAAVLLRVGLVRWPGPGAQAAVRPPDEGSAGPIAGRKAGRMAGKAGTIAGQTAEVAVPVSARLAGRIIGRSRRRTPSGEKLPDRR